MNIMIFALIFALFSGINVFAQEATPINDDAQMTLDVLSGQDVPEFSIAIPDDIKKELEELRKKQEQSEALQTQPVQQQEPKYDTSVDEDLAKQLENFDQEQEKQATKQEEIFEEFVG
ncbi:MAG: hypothetical protein BWY54_00290 [Candidatus Dependentiae bacterium ADurb.Bin331]|nr:MAG: hypothetical protein BWY54_00290 [Candidatus Dependentiae bacterium ADurb.Bin331]